MGEDGRPSKIPPKTLITEAIRKAIQKEGFRDQT